MYNILVTLERIYQVLEDYFREKIVHIGQNTVLYWPVSP